MSEQFVRIHADTDPLQAQLVDAKALLAKAPPEVGDAFLQSLFDFPLKITGAKDKPKGSRAGELRLSIELPERSREILAALRAGQG